MKYYKISIIGAGPAGIATAIQLKRLGYEPKLLEMDRIGGLLWNANLVENYPGFPKGINGPKLIRLMEKQLRNLDINITYLEITQLKFDQGYYLLTCDSKTIKSDFVVIASGTKPKPINLAIPEKARRKVHQNIQNLLKATGKHIVIIGCGDAAYDQALNLSRKNRITILNRETNVKSLSLLVQRALSNKNITYINNTSVYNMVLNPSDRHETDNTLMVDCLTKDNNKFSLKCDEVVFAIGRIPQLDFIDQITINDFCYMVGDVKNGIFRQATIAVGDGILAAMKIHNQISLRR